MFEGMYYILRTGCPWRDLPACFGPWKSVYTRYRRWCRRGLWKRMLASLTKARLGKCRSIDCSHVKVHRDGANPAGGQGSQCMGKTKGGLNTKITAMVDSLGHVVGLGLAAGNQADPHACELYFDELRGQWMVLADKAFDTNALRRKLAQNGCVACIPPRSNRKTQYYYDKELYKRRHVVENFFCRIKIYRRVATRYEKLAETYLGFVTIAAIMDWMRWAF
jgi:transposase